MRSFKPQRAFRRRRGGRHNAAIVGNLVPDTTPRACGKRQNKHEGKGSNPIPTEVLTDDVGHVRNICSVILLSFGSLPAFFPQHLPFSWTALRQDAPELPMIRDHCHHPPALLKLRSRSEKKNPNFVFKKSLISSNILQQLGFVGRVSGTPLELFRRSHQ